MHSWKLFKHVNITATMTTVQPQRPHYGHNDHITATMTTVQPQRPHYGHTDHRMAASATTHEAISMDWDETFELNHGYVHASFGRNSHMGDLLCSPVDPLFLMHHCFVDNLFERVRQNIKKNNPPLRWADLSNLPPGSDASIAINHARESSASLESCLSNSSHVLSLCLACSFKLLLVCTE